MSLCTSSEPLVQRLAAVGGPDNVVTRLYYDYQQMSASDPEAERLLDGIELLTGVRPDRTGVPANTVYVYAARVMARVREQCEAYLEDYGNE